MPGTSHPRQNPPDALHEGPRMRVPTPQWQTWPDHPQTAPVPFENDHPCRSKRPLPFKTALLFENHPHPF
jgi:hypothetical protein